MSRHKKKDRPSPETLQLPLVGIDSHAHLDIDPLNESLGNYLQMAKRAGVARIGNVFLGPGAYLKNRHLFDGLDHVFFLAGIHPNDAGEALERDLEPLRAAFESDDRLKAIGEIGLDFYWDRAPKDAQEAFFRAQLGLARDLGLPVVIHCRDAWDACLAVLDDEGFAGRALLWHCFGGDKDQAKALLDRGWHISIPGPVTYRGNDDLREAAAFVPLDRLCLETDCPFLAPEPWRGKTNHPALMAFTCAAIAELRGMAPAELWQACADTAVEFFKL